MVSPVRGDYRRCQAETPLIDLFKFARPALIQANGGVETQKQADDFTKLKEQAYLVADAMAKAKVASEISRGQQTAFLSPEDLSIATQLKGIYGDDIPRALKSSEAEALRMTTVLKTINDTARSVVSTFATDLVHGLLAGKSIMDSLAAAAATLGTKLLDTGLNSLATTGINAITGGGGSGLMAGGTSAAAAITAACTAERHSWHHVHPPSSVHVGKREQVPQTRTAW